MSRRTTGPSPRRRRLRRTLTVLTGAAVVAAGAAVALQGGVGPVVVSPRCTATVDGETYSLAPDQAANAALITGVAVQRGLPGRAASIAIATAIQESKLRNIDYGDRDSLGLFQQRPSQGWGTAEQLLDPVYATNAFYDVLVQVEGYEGLAITEAAQQVQRSAFPTAYADHEPEARAFASALTGYSPAALVCRLRAPDVERQEAGEDGLTRRAADVAAAASEELGVSGLRAGDAGSGEDEGTVLVADLGDDGEGTRSAWALAQWAVARAEGLDVVDVTTDGQRWQRGDADWQADSSAPGAGTVRVVVARGG